MGFLKKIGPRRSQVRKDISAERLSQISRLANTDALISILVLLLFVVLCGLVLSLGQTGYRPLIPRAVVVALISLAGAFYIHHYQKRIIRNHTRALVLLGLFVLLLAATKLGV